MVFLPHTNTVTLLEPYCGTITEPGLPVVRTRHVDGFHGSVIKLQSQNSEVLRILIYTRLKINIKKIFEQVSCPEACFVSKIVQFELPRFHSAWK